VGRTHFYYLFDPSVANNVKNARDATGLAWADIEALTNGAVVDIGGLFSQSLNPLDYGTAAPYANAEDKAVLTYQTAPISNPFNLFGKMRISIPAPILALFLADQETVDPANASLVTLTTKLLATDASGGVFADGRGFQPTQFIGGVLVRRKQQRKLTLYTKSPNLDEPEE
jgi:hypothetical protein